jgi:GTPase SAR1 family protein
MVMFNVLLQVLLGDVGAGKSSLVLRFVKGQFVEFQVGGYEDFWIYYIFD